MLRRMWPVDAGVPRERFVAPLDADPAAVLADTLSRLTASEPVGAPRS